MKTSNTDIMMTDSEAWLLSEPNPIGNRPDDFIQKNETWMGFFSNFLIMFGAVVGTLPAAQRKWTVLVKAISLV